MDHRRIGRAVEAGRRVAGDREAGRGLLAEAGVVGAADRVVQSEKGGARGDGSRSTTSGPAPAIVGGFASAGRAPRAAPALAGMLALYGGAGRLALLLLALVLVADPTAARLAARRHLWLERLLFAAGCLIPLGLALAVARSGGALLR